MTDEQWQKLVDVINGREFTPLPVGFIIDSPWLPGWAGISTLDYFCSDQLWFEANIKAVRRFGEVIFIPGFWAEYGMCTEPSAFGAKCVWRQSDLPFADKMITGIEAAHSVGKPNPKTDGMLPFVLNRLRLSRSRIERAGHQIRFAVARGPLNIASFLIGTTELMMAVRTHPNETHTLLQTVTDFLIDWLGLQIESFESIDGIFILDDIVGFLGDDDFRQAALPYLKRIFEFFDVTVKCFHNDADGLVCAPYLPEIGVNLFNFSHRHTLSEMKKLTGNTITLLGNIAGRDVLAAGAPEDVRKAVRATLDSVADKTRLILSCGGGMPPNVPTENIEAFLNAVSHHK